MKNGVRIFWGALALIILLAVASSFFVGTGASSGKLDTFAQCIKEKGVTFYGAFWCPHCQRTKAMFGSSAHLLPYVECSKPDGKTQTQICIDKKIESYPTWVSPATTTILTGEHTLKELSDFTGCPLPAGA